MWGNMFKLFPRTIDGDQLSIEFDYKEESDAFETGVAVLKRMRDCLRKKIDTEEIDIRDTEFPYKMRVATLKPGVNLLTTLQVETINSHKSAVIKILGVHICNVFGRGDIHMSVFTGEAQSWKEARYGFV